MNVLGHAVNQLGQFSIAVGVLMGVAGAILIASLPKNPKAVPVRVRVQRPLGRKRDQNQD